MESDCYFQLVPNWFLLRSPSSRLMTAVPVSSAAAPTLITPLNWRRQPGDLTQLGLLDLLRGPFVFWRTRTSKKALPVKSFDPELSQRTLKTTNIDPEQVSKLPPDLLPSSPFWL